MCTYTANVYRISVLLIERLSDAAHMLPWCPPLSLVLISSYLRVRLYLNRFSGDIMEVTGDVK